MINGLVGSVAPVILERILDPRDGQHEQQREHGDLLGDGIHDRHPVQQHDEHKIHVRRSMELLEQILRDEREDRVLGGLDVVVMVTAVRMRPRIDVVCDQVIRDDIPVGRLGILQSLGGLLLE